MNGSKPSFTAESEFWHPSPNCIDPLTLTVDEYARVPRTGNYFLIKPGHEQSQQRVVIQSAQYVVVETISSSDRRVEQASHAVDPSLSAGD